MESLLPFLQGTCTPYNMPVYPGAQRIIAITGQSLLIFVQVVFSLRISARIFVSRLGSRSRRLRLSPFGKERRNISSAC